MDKNHQNISNNGVERLASRNNGAADTHRVATDVDNGVTTDSAPPSFVGATPSIQQPGGDSGFAYSGDVHPGVSTVLSTNQASGRTSVVAAQLQANLAVAIRLKSENQQIKTEIYKIIHEIANTSSILDKRNPDSELCPVLSSNVEAQILQSCYDELWKCHLRSCEITADLYTKMAQRHGILWKRYKEMLKSHAVLKDDLQRLTRQLTNPHDPNAALFLICLEDDEIPIIGPQIILDALCDKRQPSDQFTQAPQSTVVGEPLQQTRPVISSNHFPSRSNKRHLEQQLSSAGVTSDPNGLPCAPTSSAPPLSKRRRLGDA